MWGSSCCTDHSKGSAIETHVPAHKMNGCMIVVVTDWVVLVGNGQSLGKSLQPSVAEFREEGEKPTVPGKSRRVVIG
jgi:hypothetical protein